VLVSEISLTDFICPIKYSLFSESKTGSIKEFAFLMFLYNESTKVSGYFTFVL